MRGRPILALAFVAFPTKVLPIEVLEEILRGGAEKVAEAGAVIGGGHSIDHDIPLYGLSVTGVVDEAKVTRNAGACPGDGLVLTKPLGIGITVCAGRADSAASGVIAGLLHKRKLPEGALDEAVAVMCTLNRASVEAMEGFDIHAATDVTGYGLLGHAHEMMDASGTTAEFSVSRVPLLSEARRLAARGIAPEGSRVNVRNLRTRTEIGAGVTDDDFLILCDAQTSGGLLLSVAPDRAQRLLDACALHGTPIAAMIGEMTASDAGRITIRR